ncbi:MAG: hypothetical protein ACRDRA_10445 [Pseudonocardiaceae bacterium]
MRQHTPAGAPVPAPQFPATGSDAPLIDSPAAAAKALRDYFLTNAEAGDNAANDELVAELVRRIRVQQASHEAMPHRK